MQTDISEADTNGIRVVTVINRKGGCGKSTLVKGLASAAADRGETVTIFDTDNNESCYQWMLNAKDQENWHPAITVIHTMDTEVVRETIDEIYAQPDQEHLILIDTKGGGEIAHDELAGLAHLMVVPAMLSRSDVLDTMQTLIWHQKLRKRVANPDAIPPMKVIISRCPNRRAEPEEVAYQEIMTSMPVIAAPITNRSVYTRMDLDGPLGVLRDRSINAGVASHIGKGIDEMTAALRAIDQVIREEGGK